MIARRGVATSLMVLFALSAARAEVTTEQGSSILLFPKVMSDSRGLQTDGFPIETIIQIANTSNSLVFAHCFYVTSTPEDPFSKPGVFNPPQWQEVDFDIMLTKQQPTHWIVGPGRRVEPNQQCGRMQPNCVNAGFDPGLIPPVTDPFIGHLVCLEVDSSGAPLNGNRLIGQATLVTPASAVTGRGMIPLGDVSKYNAVGIQGLNTDTNSNNGDQTLCLGGGVRSGCPAGAEYEACPQTVILNHFAENATEPAIEILGATASNVQTELTLIPCSEDFENQAPASVTVQFKVTNEFEEQFSTSTTVTCWANLRLGDLGPIFDASFLGTRFAQTRMTPADLPGQDPPAPGFIGVSEEFHRDDSSGPGQVSRAALNLHGEGERPGGDAIVVPEVTP